MAYQDNNATVRQPQQNETKIFIQRDYSEGTAVKFQAKYPPELDGRIERSTFESTIKQINDIYSQAEQHGGRTYMEGCLACLTAYTIYLCMDTHYNKCMKRISQFLEEENKTVFQPQGLKVTDPMLRGLRCIEITIYSEP